MTTTTLTDVKNTITVDGQQFELTTGHPASSYGIPVIVGADGQPMGPHDTCVLRLEKASDEQVSDLRKGGFSFTDCRMTRARAH